MVDLARPLYTFAGLGVWSVSAAVPPCQPERVPSSLANKKELLLKAPLTPLYASPVTVPSPGIETTRPSCTGALVMWFT